jgi:hypothetical protein
MLGAARWALVPALIAGWLLLPGTALAIVPQVNDDGKFFDAETIRKANAEIKKIEKAYKVDVVVETYDPIPEELLTKLGYKEDDRDTFFKKWVDDLADRAGVNGIVVILSKDQFKTGRVRVEVGVGRDTQKKRFTLSNRDDLARMLKDGVSAGLRDKNPKKFDDALLDGLRYIDNTLSSHKVEATSPVSAAPTRHNDGAGGSGILGWICIGLCVLLVIWLVVGVFRALFGGGHPVGGGYAGGPGYAGGYGGGGGGFFPGLLGGLFGGIAGMWLYNNMFGGGGFHQSGFESSAYGAGGGGASNDTGPNDQGQGFSSTGGDVDGGGGGGDVDGGDAGGGGGDWGGGGDAGGGGGGDWGGGGDAGGGGGDWGGGGGGGDWGGGGGGDFGGGGGGGDW